MNISKSMFLVLPSPSHLRVAFFCHFNVHGAAGGNSAEVPVIIQNGFKAWAKNRDASWAFDVWKIGGLLERDSKPGNLSRYFRQMDETLGGYQSYEVIETKRISQNSTVIYLSVNFAHAATFGRFMMLTRRRRLGGAKYGLQRQAGSYNAVAGL